MASGRSAATTSEIVSDVTKARRSALRSNPLVPHFDGYGSVPPPARRRSRSGGEGPTGRRVTRHKEQAMTLQESLRAIKLLHTAVWALFAGCIIAIPVLALMRHY